ncbi:helix-turn-helix transcriptional regulator [Sediminibacillus massiliensis]|uniref:helix-turn-helix transcriptional regulator n=1 Tax=Sediminibacillus massiliensis TaxID=1926277 RepID=UPI0009888269|nr:helix-turn-helix transcriptional regulator [Sediminibacillus massiliensis]
MNNCLRKVRRGADVTQEELALAIGTTRQTIHAIERHKLKTSPSYELMFSIANFFNKRVDEIFFTNNVRQELQKCNAVSQKSKEAI